MPFLSFNLILRVAEDYKSVWIIALGNLFAIITLIIKNVFDERKADRVRREEREDRESKLLEQEVSHRQHLDLLKSEGERFAKELALRAKLDGEQRTEALKKMQDTNQGILLKELTKNTEVTKQAAEKAEETKNIITTAIESAVIEIKTVPEG